jgi:hypothetical protein
MSRSRSLTVSAILQAVLSIFDGVSAVPILAAGSAGLPPQPGYESMGGPPFFAGVFFIIAAVSGLFAAYGLWMNQKWGKVLTIINRVLLGLFALGDFFAAPGLLRLVVVAYLLASVLVIFLVLRIVPQSGQRVTSAPPAV